MHAYKDATITNPSAHKAHVFLKAVPQGATTFLSARSISAAALVVSADRPMMRAGLPTAVTLSGIDFMTTEPEPILADLIFIHCSKYELCMCYDCMYELEDKR